MKTDRKVNFKRNMSQKKHVKKTNSESSMFSFGDPESVLNTSWTDYMGVFSDANNDYYTPPVDLNGLANLQHANAHHASAIQVRANCVTRYFKKNAVITLEEMSKAALEQKIFGQVYFRAYRNAFKEILRLDVMPGLPMRKMTTGNRYCKLLKNGQKHIYKKNEILHIKTYDVKQQIYGIPDYLGAVQSVLLNQDATLFRRRYYLNGAHMGFVFYVAGAMEEGDDDAIIKKIKETKGVGNFSNLFLNLPDGKEKSVQIIPVGDIATKDEFDRIKNITRNDIISAHRLNPALAGVMPENSAGYGDMDKIDRIDYETEVVPQQQIFERLNEFLPSNNAIEFNKPERKND